MAKGGQGKGANAQMSQPPITKYRKNIGTYQKEKTQKVAKRDFRDKADARKGINCIIFSEFFYKWSI